MVLGEASTLDLVELWEKDATLVGLGEIICLYFFVFLSSPICRSSGNLVQILFINTYLDEIHRRAAKPGDLATVV